MSKVSLSSSSSPATIPSVPPNWPNSTESDLRERPNRLINIGRAQDYLFPSNFVKTSKYEWYNFFPKFLMEEFHPKNKIANCYFLLIAILQTIPAISNTQGYPTVLIPLTFVVTVDAIFAAIEDLARHRADTEANSAYTKRYEIHNQGTEDIIWADINVGDFIKIHSREKVPADIVVISVAEKTTPAQGLCYVETKSLDGETNLKTRQALKGTLAKCTDFNSVQHLRGKIEMEHPNKMIDSFTGVIELEGIGREPILPQNVILRGCILRNTDWVIGCVVNTGHHTKILMSSAKTPNKASQLDVLASLEVRHMVVLLATVCLVGALGSLIWNSVYDVKNAWYMQWENLNLGVYFVIQFFYFFLLHATFIPVSLYVSMTLVRFFQSYFMNNDLEMYYEKTDTPALVRTMTLNEELGQISHVFSDKTGTLTCNVMDFRKASINGISYGLGITEIGKASWKLQGKDIPVDILQGEEKAKEVSVPHVSFYDPKFEDHRRRDDLQSTRIQHFFRILSLCHDTIPERIDGKIKLSASNPDDEALVCAANYFGFEFKDRQGKTALVWNNYKQTIEEIEILESITFSSKRKRMSVITKGADGILRMYIKGADNVMIPRLKHGQEHLIADTDEHLRLYAIEGLRCLLVGSKDLSPQEYSTWSTRYAEASTDMDELEKKKSGQFNQIEELEDEIEQGFTLVGCTAIEDKLQDGVPETIAMIARAGLNIWMLTGDKEETAINIAVACNLVLPKDYMRHVIVNKRLCPTLQRINELLEAEVKLCEEEIRLHGDGNLTIPRALIIDGPSLIVIMASVEGKNTLLDFSRLCKAVVGCRVSPDQKREMVNLIKTGVPGVRTLAIGDGANDVAMIQEAHIGVGIRGEEGLQATNASDYAIAQFRYLGVLLLKHGRYNYLRMTNVVLYMFYKNVMMSICHFWYAWLNGFSGEKMFTEGAIQFYNLFYTSLPIIILGVYDIDIQREIVYRFPQLYEAGVKNLHFNGSLFWWQILNAVSDAVLLTYLPLFQLTTFSLHGVDESLWHSGSLIFTAIVVLANIKVSFLICQWTFIPVFLILISIGSWFLIALIVSNTIIADSNWYHLWEEVLQTTSYWLSLICVVGAVLLKDLYLLLLRVEFNPSKTQVILESDLSLSRQESGNKHHPLAKTELKLQPDIELVSY